MKDEIVSPLWKACKNYQRCTEKQSEYIEIFDYNTKNLIDNNH